MEAIIEAQKNVITAPIQNQQKETQNSYSNSFKNKSSNLKNGVQKSSIWGENSLALL
jgi:hypothetical protein